MTHDELRIRYWRAWLSDADKYFSALQNLPYWKQEKIRIFGKAILTPRLTAFVGDEGCTYRYSGLINRPQEWTNELLSIKNAVEDLTETQYNVVLANYYRTGQDSMSWHSDDEPELGINPIIASVNLGGSRIMQFRTQKDKKKVAEITLHHGDVLLMYDNHQHLFQHQIPKTTKLCLPRMNLTFRKIRI